MTTLRFEGVSKSYGQIVAVHPLTLEIQAGTWCVVVGPNGSGKTTMLRLACGLLSPTEGAIAVGGAPAGTPTARVEVSYLSDSPAFYSDLSVSEHVDYVAGLFEDNAIAERAHQILRAFDLTERVEDLPDTFSRGMKQKTAIALALARPFSILLLDEPTRGLDVAGAATMVEVLRDENAKGRSIITVTHEPERFDVPGAVALHVDNGVFEQPRPLRASG